MSKNTNTVTVSTGSFGTLSWCVWIVFMILYYGIDPSPIAHWNKFWVWFPFWLPFAIAGVFFLIGIIACVVMAGILDNE